MIAQKQKEKNSSMDFPVHAFRSDLHFISPILWEYPIFNFAFADVELNKMKIFGDGNSLPKDYAQP